MPVTTTRPSTRRSSPRPSPRCSHPNDEPETGKRLRLLQQYFFVSCSLQDILNIHLNRVGLPLTALPDKRAIQLNDTHPSIAVAELMRLLIDDHH